jgi:signal transduction histidine kinase
MMRSLSLKLILAFMSISLIGVALVAIFAIRLTANEFGNFIFDQNREGLVTNLSEYYRTHGGWIGVDEYFPFSGLQPPRGPMGVMGERSSIALMNKSGKVIMAGMGYRKGDHVTQSGLAQSLAIEVDGEEVGRLLAGRNAFRPSGAGEAFLDRVNRMLLYGAIGATAVALILGIVLARTLTRPLRELTAATRAVAEGDLELQVPVRSHDELGQLAASFNQMNTELAHARNLRRQMTADIAHELRTPLSIILGHTEAVQDGVFQPSLETFHIIHDEANRLDRLVEDLRTLSLAEAGELPLDRRPVSLEMLLEKAIAAHSPVAQQKEITLQVKVASDLPDIDVDPDRMLQVLGNLLSNALFHTPNGGLITLSAMQTQQGIEIHVQDNGPGVAPEELSRIFDRFYRGDKSRQRNEGTSGLGLAIAKSIVEEHGGRIRVESKLGEGATFIIALQAQQKSA